MADYTQQPHTVTAPGPGPAVRCAAVQHTNTPRFDVSTVFDDGWPHHTAVTAPPLSAVPVWPAGVVLRVGDTGDAVRVLQAALRDSSIRGVRGIMIDGVFGQQTLTSLRNFQAARGLAVDGVAGRATRAALGI